MLKGGWENKMLKERYFTKIKVNKKLHGHKVGEVVRVETCKAGIPLVREWRNRLKDASKDNCVEIVNDKKEIKNKIEEVKEDDKENKYKKKKGEGK